VGIALSWWLRVGAIILAVLSAGPGWAHADVVIATETQPTTVSAFGGLVLWSSAVPTTGQYVLRSWNGTSIETLPIPARDAPFDADLGPDAHGRPVAVYSRCTSETRNPLLAIGPFPDYRAGRGCDLFRYHFDARREERLRSLSSPSQNEFTPTIWGTHVAFARDVGNAKRRASQLYVGTLRSDQPTRRIRGGDNPFDRAFCASRARPSRLDLRASRLVFAWDDVCGTNPPLIDCEGQQGGFTPPVAQVWDVSIAPGGSRRRVQSVCSGGSENPGRGFASPALAQDRLFYLVRGRSRSDSLFQVRRRRGQNVTDRSAPFGSRALTADGSRLVVGQDAGENTFNIVVLGKASNQGSARRSATAIFGVTP